MGYQTYHSVPLSSLGKEGKLRARSLNALEVDVAQLHHPLLPPITLSSKSGIGPDQAAVLSVLLSPKLVAERDRRGLAQAQLVQAGVLPNPSIGVTREFVTGGFTTGAFDPYGFNASWDVSSLVSHGAKVKAARTNVDAVSLDVAWTEWQTAEGAKLAFYRVVALETQLIRAKQIDADQQATVTALQAAVDRHERNVVDLAAAQAVRQDSLTAVLALEQELEQRRLALKRAIGFLPRAQLAIRHNFALPSSVSPPSEKELIANLENQRLDLVGLRAGYQSQEETVRACYRKSNASEALRRICQSRIRSAFRYCFRLNGHPIAKSTDYGCASGPAGLPAPRRYCKNCCRRGCCRRTRLLSSPD